MIIPVLYEQAALPKLLAHLHGVCAQLHQVIIVDGDPQGSTLAAVSPLPTGVMGITASAGRGSQLNAGAALATGEVLLFLHVDNRLPPQAIPAIQGLLEDPKLSGGAFDLRIDATDWRLRIIGRISSWRSRLTRIPYGDQGIFVRRAVFESIGGYPDFPIMEDVALMQRMKQQGYRIQFLATPIQVSARRWQKEGLLYTTLRNWLLMFLYHWGVSPHRLARWYRPHHASRASSPSLET
ncbi:TIGR04283 family arsenosugar biosynthesis glycosyltransferase [Lyngbya confervoides]|uniref:4,4'-diaponeurosporenoate glycosyltransferase n=1 Tax=Lyngbya confervoides BDU141951 TaxID=1574623 RepID=A0ABD4SZB0_9CYAN|nr:TIGR04283 family arsenosugar biosynthesis glycosyltransferase [Lyngbya confervoides]MCM1981766.1 TIGR04283 family arsenosugar biosynthesis glycosyltransferase [Lyngbya confervoides BDU141951]